MSEDVQGCGYTEDYCRRGYGCVIMISALVSVASTITSLALCDIKPGQNNAGIGWAIGILGTLLTFAVAWQIWQTIASREEIQEAREAIKRIDTIQKKVDEIVPLTDAHLQFSIVTALRTKGLDFPEVRSDNFGGDEKSKMSHRALFTCMAFSQYLSILKLYSEIELNAKEYIEKCLQSIEDMAMRMRGNYDLVTKGLINIMISDLDSVLIQCGKALKEEQISTLKDLKQELTRNLSNGIDEEEALAKKRKQRKDDKAAEAKDNAEA